MKCEQLIGKHQIFIGNENIVPLENQYIKKKSRL
jgi:hypothetical protein